MKEYIIDLENEDKLNNFHKGYKLYKSQQYEEALKEFDKSIELDNENIVGEAYLCKGAILSLIDKKEASQVAYEQALNKFCSGAYYNKGLLLFNAGRYGEAFEYYEKAIELEPNDFKLYNEYGRNSYYLENFELATQAYDKAISLKNDYAIAYYNKSQTLCKIGKYEAALNCLDKATKLELNNYKFWNAKGAVLESVRKYEEALESVNKAIKLKNNYVDAYINKANILQNLLKIEEAYQYLNKALELEPNNANVWYNKGKALYNNNRYDEALIAFDKSIEILPKNPDTIRYKAITLSKKEQYKEALKIINMALNINSKDIEALIAKGDIYYCMGNYDEAKNLFNEVTMLGDNLNKIGEVRRNEVLQKLKEVASEKDILYLIENTPLSQQARVIALQKYNSMKTLGYDYFDRSYNLKYLRSLLKLPWGKYSETNIDINKAKEELEKNHYGLEEVKNKIIESLVFMARSKEAKPPIICLVGAPGVGKTSIANSIANALQRKIVRLSLAGANDPGIIRGCMSYYTSSSPGKIMSLMSEAGTCNPVMVLDEIDKIDSIRGKGVEGTLLQVIDPSQNNNFTDDYFDFSFDLSKVLFIATANSLEEISHPLSNRMEIIEIKGYTEDEQVEISKNYILPQILCEANLSLAEFNVSEEIIRYLIDNYTAEAGVREIERLLRTLVQKYLLEKLKGNQTIINVKLIETYFVDSIYNQKKLSSMVI
ncbi:MAG TPA: tetratricopeptide repeat protein [Rickettsia endosymbiont of Omalisus fontisbellaquei]|nr:tetratricopeptide repeat protein [Rickettsia endosymbiont of Omalisus fontisbellaquei]